MKKKTVALVLSLILFLTSITFTVLPVFSATYIEEDDWKYEVPSVNAQEYYISSYLGSAEEVRVPSLFQGKPVTKICNNAFLNNTALKAVDIPDTITSIGQNAFYGCSSLEVMTIPANVTELNTNVFFGCTSLTSVNFEENTKITAIPRNCFSGCSSLIAVTIPQGITTIADRAFLNCIALKDVVIYPSVTDISTKAFKGCENMQILGWNDTYAQQYAEENNIPFVSFGDYTYPTVSTEPQTTSFPTVPESSTVADIPESSSVSTQPTIPVSTSSIDETQPTVPVTSSAVVTTVPISIPTSVAGSTVPVSSSTVPVSSSTVPASSSTVAVSSEVTESTAVAIKYIIGDADFSGNVTVKDATHIQKYAADLVKLDRTQLFLANCDGKGGVNVKDATQIQKYCAGFKNILFVGNEVDL